MTAENKPALISTGEATAILPAGNVSPITVIGTEAIPRPSTTKHSGKRSIRGWRQG